MLKEVELNVNQEDAKLIMEFLYNPVRIIIGKAFRNIWIKTYTL